MKRFISILTVAAVATMMATSAFAQTAGPKGGQQQGGQQGQGEGGRRGGGGGGFGGMRMQANPEMAKKLKEIQTKIFKQIGLSSDQVKKVEALQKEREAEGKKMFEQMQKDREAGKQGDQAEMRAKFQEFGKKFNDGMTKIMGKEKYDQYQKLMRAEMQKMREEMEKNGGGPGAGGPGQRQGAGGGGGAKAGGGN